MTRYLLLSELCIGLALAIAIVAYTIVMAPEAHSRQRMHCYFVNDVLICCTTNGNLTTCQ